MAVNRQTARRGDGCELALKLEDATRTRSCVAALKALGVESSQIVAYEWALALMTKDTGRGRELLENAKKAGIPGAAIGSMERSLAVPQQAQAHASPRGASLPAWWPAAAAGLLIFSAIVVMLRRRARLQHSV